MIRFAKGGILIKATLKPKERKKIEINALIYMCTLIHDTQNYLDLYIL